MPTANELATFRQLLSGGGHDVKKSDQQSNDFGNRLNSSSLLVPINSCYIDVSIMITLYGTVFTYYNVVFTAKHLNKKSALIPSVFSTPKKQSLIHNFLS